MIPDDQLDSLKHNLTPVLKGDNYAVDFCVDIFRVAHTWDDLIDGVALTKKQISDSFVIMMYEIPRNLFYRTYLAELTPVMMNCILQWQSANVLDDGSEPDKDKAYMLRASIYHIVTHAALLVGGREWAEQVAPEIYRLYAETRESVYA